MLKRDGWKVRALTRDPSSKASQRLAEKGAEVRFTSWAPPRSAIRPYPSSEERGISANNRPSLALQGIPPPARLLQVIKADFDDTASLAAAFQGADAVFGVTGACDGGRALASAAG